MADPGRRGEFERLLEPILGSLYHTALGFVREPAEAEDVVQESVLRAYRAFDQFEPGTNFKAWVLRILTNLCINRHQRRQRGPELVALEDVEREAEAAGSRQSSGAEPESAVFDGLLGQEVHEAIAQLPPEFRSVLILSDLHEYSYQEIAGVLQIPVGTVRSRLFRARRLLRGALREFALSRGLIREGDLD